MSCAVLSFAKELAKNKKAPSSCIIIGDEVQLINEARAAIATAAAATATERLDMTELDEDISAGGASLFGSRLCNIVRHSLRPSEEAQATLLKIVNRPADNDVYVISFYGFDERKIKSGLSPQKKKADEETAREGWLKELQNNAKVKVIKATRCDDIAGWCSFWSPDITPEAVAAIGGQTVGNLGAAKQAVMKMALYGGTTAEDARRALSDGGKYGVFDVADRAVCHLGREAFQILAQLLAENTPAPLILWSIGNAAQQLLKIKRDNPAFVFGAWGQKLDKMRRTARTTNEETILEVIRRAARADRIIKGMSYKTTDDKGATIKVALTNLVADLASLGRNVPMPLPGRAVLEDD